MLLHLSGERTVSAKDIIAILDVRLCGAQGRPPDASGGKSPKSAVLTGTRRGTDVLYSSLSPKTLCKRVNTDTIL